MRRLSAKQREKRIDHDFREALIKASYEAQDPGLRDRFGDLPRLPVRLICCRLVKLVNHGGLIRLAEAFRLQEVSFDAEEDEFSDFGGAKGAHEWVHWEWSDPLEAIKRAKDDGCHVVGLTLNDRAVGIEKFEWKFPCALVLGEEKFGLTPEIENACDSCVAIPLFGMITSLNVTHAAVIGVWEANQAYRSQNPDFEPARQVSQRLM